MTMLGALLAHIAVNLLNEYQDNLSGLDFMTAKTPFSGGSGALQLNPNAANAVLNTFRVSVLLLIGLGIAFLFLKGWQILPIGVVGLSIVILYTSKITKSPWFCLISPGLAFGPLMVLGSYFVLTGQLSWLVLSLSMVPFFLVNNLLLLNQLPDLQADKKVGRYNILMKLGVRPSIYVFAGFELLAFLSLLITVYWFGLPVEILLAAVMFVLAIPMVQIALRHYDNPKSLMPALAMNVIINVFTPVLMAVGLWINQIH
ncbi:1,4-dihydroxy-2-naphthoate octaprenyltransferase [Thiomicrorhabdus immobilis]|uniref:1,4-dihydroxy-2-naphthoate octaprenyltransferase n=2 Tax=Thiomicrorhabdus immobilis TaxID=2791037 RepID=A0ABM7MDJ9_9GAMM|nr:1,4-dihydroxy-2-naphthoate octaprenyltransferase [Thiomicrorhabdus immobilis]